MEIKTIVLGGGCFWCTEAVFKMLRGVKSVLPGYAGGDGEPNYEAVTTGSTGHAEVIKIEYDDIEISLNDLLTVFFASHDPTTLNRQGADVGTQYRSIILFTESEQEELVKKFISELNSSTDKGKTITTEVKKLDKFFPAEDYHLNYYENNQNAPYCELVINPKLEKVQKNFAELMKKQNE